MLKPALVADCVRSLRDATHLPVTVKCRIGIDERDDYEFFRVRRIPCCAAGIDALIVHARVAILGGLSPKQNREIPPLKHDLVHRLKRDRPDLTVILNGGLCDGAAIGAHLQRGRRRRDDRTGCLSSARAAGRTRAESDRSQLADSASPGRSSSAWFLTPKPAHSGVCACIRSRATCTASWRDAKVLGRGVGFFPRWRRARKRRPKRCFRPCP